MLVRSKNAKNVKTLKQFSLHFFLPSPLRQFSLRFFLHNITTLFDGTFSSPLGQFLFIQLFWTYKLFFACTFFSSSDAIPEEQQ